MHFTALIHQAAQKAVDILITPYHDVHPFDQDAVVATYRAVENGFSLLRPTGAGLTTIIDFEGRVLASQNFYTTSDGILLASVPTHGVTTIYNRIGDLFAYLCAAGFVIFSAWVLVAKKRAVGLAQGQPARQ